MSRMTDEVVDGFVNFLRAPGFCMGDLEIDDVLDLAEALKAERAKVAELGRVLGLQDAAEAIQQMRDNPPRGIASDMHARWKAAEAKIAELESTNLTEISRKLVEAEAKVAELDSRLKKQSAELEIKSDFIRSRQCSGHSGKWERGRCLQCEIEAAEAQLAALQKNHDRWEKTAKDERRRCKLLDEELTALQTAIDATGEVHPSWNTSKDFQDGWRECIAHIREDAERPATYFADMRRQLSELREGLEGLPRQKMIFRDQHIYWVHADAIDALLKKHTPTVNSAEAVDGGEDSGGGV